MIIKTKVFKSLHTKYLYTVFSKSIRLGGGAPERPEDVEQKRVQRRPQSSARTNSSLRTEARTNSSSQLKNSLAVTLHARA